MADVDNKIKMIVEGLLLAAGKPLGLNVIASVFSEDERPDNAELKDVLAAIADDCNDRGFELKQVASGYRFQVKQEISEWIARLWEEKPPRYSRALLETLALIAYRQPITRGDVEEIRGVGVSSNIIRTLVDREWVRIVGHKDVPGKPALYATTRQFLDYFNLASIQELPPLSDIRELAQERDKFDVEDDLAQRNVLEVPEEGSEESVEVLDSEGEPLDFEADELPDEEEAVALSKKPLDEILGLSDEDDEDEDYEEGAEDQEDQRAQRDQENQAHQEFPVGREVKADQEIQKDPEEQAGQEEPAGQDTEENQEVQTGQETQNGPGQQTGQEGRADQDSRGNQGARPGQEKQDDLEGQEGQWEQETEEVRTLQEAVEDQEDQEQLIQKDQSIRLERDDQSETAEQDADEEGQHSLQPASESSAG